jgi:hypothetical protein
MTGKRKKGREWEGDIVDPSKRPPGNPSGQRGRLTYKCFDLATSVKRLMTVIGLVAIGSEDIPSLLI